MKIGIGNDHTAIEMKNEITSHLVSQGYEVVDYGTNSPESFDYPISGYKVGKAVAGKEVDCGIFICGTGVCISLAGCIYPEHER